jgi:hypothetical protein
MKDSRNERKIGLFHFFYLYTTQIIILRMCLFFLFASLQLRSQEELFFGRKVLEWHLILLVPPVFYLCCSLLCICKCLMLNQHLSGTERFFKVSVDLITCRFYCTIWNNKQIFTSYAGDSPEGERDMCVCGPVCVCVCVCTRMCL